jgi:choline dehydrogenase-like flavoprotein
VLLLEAGPPDSGRIFELPALFSTQFKSAFDWDLLTEPEPQLDRRRLYLPRGRALGGTSSMNTTLYVRGHRRDYDEWAENGAEGWSYEDVLPFFLRSEDNERGANAFHAVGGPLRVSDPRSPHPLLEAWVDAAVEAGHRPNDDFNGPVEDGVGLYQVTQRDGLRCSTAAAFLRPAEDRPNLTIWTGATATRVIFERRRAKRVELERYGQFETVEAECEVVISAGAYLSPQLLMLSGIGPAEHLRAHGIEVRADLPVGMNLQDHPGCFLSYFSRIPDVTGNDTEENERLLRSSGRGPLTWAEAGGFARTSPELDAPDLQFHAAPGMFADDGLAESLGHALAFGPYPAKPASRGRLWLRSKVPTAKPRILHNYLSDPRDLDVLRAGLRMAMTIARKPSLAELLEPEGKASAAGLIPRSTSDEDIDAYIRSSVFSFFHPCGTCAIGDVVDTELSVFETEGLRVADASVMPSVIRGNTNAPAIMIGERAAEFIRGRPIAPAATQTIDVSGGEGTTGEVHVV